MAEVRLAWVRVRIRAKVRFGEGQGLVSPSRSHSTLAPIIPPPHHPTNPTNPTNPTIPSKIARLGGHPVLVSLIEYLDRQVADEPEDPGKIKGSGAASGTGGTGSDGAGDAQTPMPPDAPPDRLSMPKLGKTDSF